ncbi:hypothetical protein ABIA35_009855 [Catenulispora sp. MAP12-49]|uniref:hypothetical protein n=1 Tax=Catenulispora sp. MAP12-49 TaxID=3156302 RepID=UPI0035176D9D
MTTVIAHELWRSERDVLHDLAAFVAGHGPDADHPLPLLHWYVGPSHTVHAEIHSLDRENGGGHRDPAAVLAAYADALHADVMELPNRDHVLFVARGRLGPEGDDGSGRTHAVIRARIPVVDDRKVGGRAFLP